MVDFPRFAENTDPSLFVATYPTQDITTQADLPRWTVRIENVEKRPSSRGNWAFETATAAAFVTYRGPGVTRGNTGDLILKRTYSRPSGSGSWEATSIDGTCSAEDQAAQRHSLPPGQEVRIPLCLYGIDGNVMSDHPVVPPYTFDMAIYDLGETPKYEPFGGIGTVNQANVVSSPGLKEHRLQWDFFNEAGVIVPPTQQHERPFGALGVHYRGVFMVTRPAELPTDRQLVLAPNESGWPAGASIVPCPGQRLVIPIDLDLYAQMGSSAETSACFREQGVSAEPDLRKDLTRSHVSSFMLHTVSRVIWRMSGP
ncbi:hypothetical protein BI330_20390 [Mycobacterium sp. CBMA 623]|nr:hypothetical protein [Mycobacteroides sp. CBMA 326]